MAQTSGGIGFAGALAILFIALKLTGYIAWSWVWVLSPIWISLAFAVLILLIVGFIMSFFKMVERF